jgi:hypothetical protein
VMNIHRSKTTLLKKTVNILRSFELQVEVNPKKNKLDFTFQLKI